MKYDIAVIGGGPAGMMAAAKASEMGARVVLLERNPKLGAKLLLTGRGRCNITNNIEDMKELVGKYGRNGKFLFSSLNNFGPKDVMYFFEKRGVKVKTERGGRVFPESDKAIEVLKTLIDYMVENKVEYRKNSQVRKIVSKHGIIEKLILKNKEEVFADKFIIATGGKSYPEVGAKGDGFKWLEELGHKIEELKPSLVPISVKEKDLAKRLEGLSLKNVEIGVYRENKKIDSRFGEALFTSRGLSGPIILDLSRRLREEKLNNTKIRIDFKPALDFTKLDLRIQKDFSQNINKNFRNSLDKLLPQKLIPVFIELSGIDAEKKVNDIRKEERRRLLHLFKEFELSIESLGGFERAIMTAGGVSLSEIDPKTMRSKLIKNLYLAGELLDLDGPTGGYNLQVCWATGFNAGQSAALDRS